MSFADDIKAFAEKTKISLDVVHRKVVFDITNSLIAMSPVDTGRFRNNWNIGIGRPDTSTTEGVGDPTGRLQGQTRSLTVGGVVYITNSLPYAIPLEYGHSDQAPSGMVRVTLIDYQQYLQDAIRSLK